MNKNILLIFVMIMALLLFGISCSNDTTKPNNNTTNVAVTVNSLENAALGGLGKSLEIKNGVHTIILSANNTEVTVSETNIVATITDTAINTSKAGEVLDTMENVNKVFDNFKTEMSKVGVNITDTTVHMGTGAPYPNGFSLHINASKALDTETTKYKLPTVITNLQRVIIRIVLGNNATWTFNGQEYQ